MRIKKAQTVYVACIVYIAALISIYYAINAYIEDKVIRLREEALTALNSFFEQKPMYVDLLYGPYRCSYEEVEIPQPEVPSFTDILNAQKFFKEMEHEDMTYEEVENRVRTNLFKKWEETYGNFTRMYDLDIYPTESETLPKRGWALKIIKKKPEWANTVFEGGGVETYFLFPKQVAYKRIAPLLQGAVPSIETAVQEALEFVVTNEKSDLQPYYSRGSSYNLEDRMKSAIDNEYYYFTQDTDVGTIRYGDGSSTVGNGSMYNGYYEVFFHRTQPKTYSIRYVGDDIVNNDKYIMIAIYAGILTLIVIGILHSLTKKKKFYEEKN